MELGGLADQSMSPDMGVKLVIQKTIIPSCIRRQECERFQNCVAIEGGKWYLGINCNGLGVGVLACNGELPSKNGLV